MLVLLCAGALPCFALEDPTRPPSHGGTRGFNGASDLPVLNSILNSNNRRVAMIDNRPMLEGDVYEGMRVRQIRADAVVLNAANGSEITLRLGSERVTKEFK